jgi:hypothetical protein
MIIAHHIRYDYKISQDIDPEYIVIKTSGTTYDKG